MIITNPANYPIENIVLSKDRIGITKAVLRGKTSELKGNFFSKNGFRVLSFPTNDIWTIEIDYPYHNLPAYVKNGHYIEDSFFFIQQKMQITYTLEINSIVKDYNPMESNINDSIGMV